MGTLQRLQIASTKKLLHRVRLLFVLLVLLPTLAVGAIAYFQVRGTLEDEAFKHLHEDNRFHSAQLLERLLSINTDLLALQQRFSVTAETIAGYELTGTLQDKLDGLFVLSNDGASYEPLLPASDPQDIPVPVSRQFGEHIHRSALLVEESSGRIWMKIPAAPGGPQSKIGFHALINERYLFGDDQEQLWNAELCVFSKGAVLYCTSRAQRYREQLLAMYEAGNVTYRSPLHESARGKIFVVSRELFLPSQFDSSVWTVVTLEEESVVFAPIQVFGWLFPALLSLLILGSFLILSIQTRRRFKPLEVLRTGAQRLGGGEFGTRIEVTSGDEFEELANTFNQMAVRLGNQFGFLAVMSKIDSILLNQPDRLDAAETIVREVPEKLGLDLFCLVLMDSATNTARLIVYDPDENDGICTHRASQGMSILGQAVADNRLYTRVVLAEAADAQEYFPEGINVLRVYPLAEPGQFYGAVCVNEHEIASAGEEVAERMADVVRRFTVALSAVERQKQIYDQAHFDGITGLPNRALFVDRLEQSIRHAARAGTKFSVIYADLDRFKIVNDTHGHDCGDDVLRETARRLEALLRESDTVARISGDEFVFALPGAHKPPDVVKVVEEIVATLKEPFRIRGQEFALDVSIGISTYPEDGDNAEELLKNADLAMYRAKANPGSRYRFFEEAINSEVQERSELGQDLLHAVSRGEMALVYQPKVDAGSFRIHSVEALVRWCHPAHGWISPAKFIPIAEQTGAIQKIGEFALSQACANFSDWRRRGLPIEQIAVNISPQQVLYSDLPAMVANTLSKNRMQPSHLELEITENLLIDDYLTSEKVLSELKSIGVSVALDDFGTGYSSLSHIHQLTFDTLKIDKCFIDDLGVRPNAGAIVDSILAMGKSLGKAIVAEGVTNKQQLDFLQSRACKLYQGYYFSKPVTAGQLEELLANAQALPVATVDQLSPEQKAVGTH